MINSSGLAPKMTDASEPPARPKVMRRPAHFSAPKAVIPNPETAPKPAPAPATTGSSAAPTFNEKLVPVVAPAAEPAVEPSRPWQDDARFGIVMLTIVVLVNLALMLWLPNMRAPQAALDATEVTATKDTLLPDSNNPPITIYSKSAPEPQPSPRLTGADSGPNQ